jgi:hypothetical protein
MSGDITLNQALSVWSDLEQAYFGKNGFGGDTAEIYAYRLQPYNPSAHLNETVIGEKAKREQAVIAGSNLFFLLRTFMKMRDCYIEVDGEDPETLLHGLVHRCHAKVIHKEKRLGSI